MQKQIWLTVLAAVVVAGIGCDDGGGGDGGEGEDQSIPVIELPPALEGLVADFQDYFTECLFDDLGYDQEFLAAVDPDFVTFFDFRDTLRAQYAAALSSPHVTFVESAVASCSAYLETCGRLNDPGPCADILVGDVIDGDACHLDAECASQRCDSEDDACGTCLPVVQNPCYDDEACEDVEYCRDTECIPLPVLGESCEDSDACAACGRRRISGR